MFGVLLDNLVGKERVLFMTAASASLKIDQEYGDLHFNVQASSWTGAWPRGCALSPDEKHFMVSCPYSDEMIRLPY